MKTASARMVAARVLRRVAQREGFSNRLLAEALDATPGLSARDRGLITNLVYGVLRHQLRLDHHIDAAARKPKSLKGLPRELVRVAAFEVLELDRPLAIAADEASRALDTLDPSRRMRAMASGILGTLAEQAPDEDRRLDAAGGLDAMEKRWSVPRWLAGRWIKTLGEQTALARARALSAPPYMDLRLDLSRTRPESIRQRLLTDHPGIELRTVEGQPQCLRTRGGGDLFYGPVYGEGLISVQALGSQQAVLTLAPQPGERVLDACAGLGGKTVHIAESMKRQGELVAVDPDPRRLAELDGQRERAGLDADTLAFEVHCSDLQSLDPSRLGQFDAILVDAPCTGLGNLARHPELRYTASYEDIQACAALQVEIVQHAASLLRPGGRLVYAVCSLEPDEGPKVHEQLAGRLALVDEVVFTPERYATDGFYLAHLVPA